MPTRRAARETIALRRQPGLRRQDFFEAFPFREAATEARIDRVLRQLAT